MVKYRRSKSVAVALFGVIAMAFLIACAGAGSSDSAKSSDPKRDSGPESLVPIPEALTKSIQRPVVEDNALPASAIASLIQAAESNTADTQVSQLTESITEAADSVLEESIKASTTDPEELAQDLADAMETIDPLVEMVMEAVEGATEDSTDTATALISDATSSDAMSGAMSLENLAKDLKDLQDLVEDTNVQTVLSSISTEGELEPSAEAESAPALVTTFDQFGFTMNIDLGSEIQTAQGSGGEQGAIYFPLGEFHSILTWVPEEGSTPLALVSGTYDILKANQTGVSFDSINDGGIVVNGQQGVYLGFKSTDDTGASLGGGLIGAWTCGDGKTAYTLSLTGADAGTLQIRFDRLLENFTCAA